MPATFRITRDQYGIPHVKAADRRGAFAGQAYAMAQDRFFQMEVDRRYSSGRLSQLLDTPGARASDAFVAKSRIAESYAFDVESMEDSTKEMLSAFTEGVNGYLAAVEKGAEQLPPEWAELSLPRPSPWTALDSLSVFKGRHLTMSNFGNKMARWKTVNALGPQTAGALLAGWPRLSARAF